MQKAHPGYCGYATTLAARVEKVLALHSRSTGEDVYCQGCVDQFWPCATVRILDGEE